jgi:Sec-independent protein secretion pathway component TatC
MLFVYFLVLPWTLEFFIAFSTDVPLPAQKSPVVQLEPNNRPSGVMMIAGDPANPTPGEMWFDTTQKRLKFFINGEVKIISFSAQNLIATEYNMPEYIDLVVGMLLTFGLSFQMPLVVMALARIGIVEIDMLRSFRKYVYFAMSIIAAAITPGDVITATVALMIPLCLLYELGIWLAVMGERRSAREST